MANIKSAKKRILVTETKTARNKAIRSEVKDFNQEGRRLLVGLQRYKDCCRRLHIRMLLQLSRVPALRCISQEQRSS